MFYRFVDPEKRLGDRLNYRDRILGATGIVLPNGSIIFDARRNRDVPLVDRARYLALADSVHCWAVIRQIVKNLRDDSDA